MEEKYLYIKEIKDIDKFSGEADVIVTDGTYELLCYYYLGGFVDINMPIKSISALFTENIMRSEEKRSLIERTDHYYSYHLCGCVEDVKIPKMSIGKISITLDHPLPKDIEIGEYIELDVQRLDVTV